MSSASPMEAVVSYLKNPGGGAADVSLNDSGKMTAGGIMAAIGFGGLILAMIIGGSFEVRALIHVLIFFILATAIMFGFSMLGVNMGKGEKGLGEALIGAGSAAMYVGIVFVVFSLLNMVLKAESGFMIALLFSLYVGLMMLLGIVSYGNWANRYKADGIMASYVSIFTVSLGIGFGAFLYFSLMFPGGASAMGGIMRYMM